MVIFQSSFSSKTNSIYRYSFGTYNHVINSKTHFLMHNIVWAKKFFPVRQGYYSFNILQGLKNSSYYITIHKGLLPMSKIGFLQSSPLKRISSQNQFRNRRGYASHRTTSSSHVNFTVLDLFIKFPLIRQYIFGYSSL